MLVTSPLINLATKALFSVNILDAKMLFNGRAYDTLVAVVAYFTTVITYDKNKHLTALKTGDR